MPGDAFFHSRLTEEVVSNLDETGGSLTFAYSRPGSFTFCGYAGFARLEVSDIDPGTVRWLRQLYQELRFQFPKQIAVVKRAEGADESRELNGLHLLVYNRGFDPQRFRIALKYNESWHSPPQGAVGPDRIFTAPARVYDPFVRSYDAVVEDWNNSARVEGLAVEVPADILWARSGPEIERPIRARAEDLRFFVFANGSLTKHFRRKNGEAFWEVTASGVKMHSWKRRKLTTVDWQPERRAGTPNDEVRATTDERE